MILTLTINLAIDKVAILEKFEAGKENRIQLVSSLPGGKGANVSRALKSFKEEVLICGLKGGKNGEFIEEGLVREGINPILFPIEEENRVCLILVEKSGVVTEIYEVGPRIEEEIQEKFLNFFREVWKDFSWIIVSGSLPPGFPEDYYARLLRGRRGKKLFLDFHTGALLKALEEEVFLLKINEREFLRTFKEPDLLPAIKTVIEKFPIQYLVVTLGENGVLGADQEKIYSITSTYKPGVICPVGAGDAFMGGLVHAFKEGKDFKEALLLATAASISNVTLYEGGRVNPEEFERILKGKYLQIEIL
ncbi:MAG: 1-phosphofructokinase family hexose kinase [Caldiserica bacterium]|jgi:tagatose 6-phosphate kinase|nr:1-phosphofructokinase family hexose kinase [Caldisericota bacterium]